MTLFIQDPGRQNGPILIDELLRALEDTRFTRWQGLYAFASAKGAVAAFGDESFEAFLARGGEVDLVVGLDAVTNPAALLKLREHISSAVRVSVFASARAGAIFHPKLSVFAGHDEGRLIIGSGNFTEGGFRRNYEAFVTVDDGATALDQWNSELKHFRARNIDQIGPIDDAAIARAQRNERIARAARQAAKQEVVADPVVVVETDDDVLIAQELSSLGKERRTLVAQVPRARWGQVQFDQGTAGSYFGLSPGASFAITLEGIDEHGDAQATELRRLVLSDANGNAKIEFSTRRNRTYPTDDHRPILVVREDASRTFVYSLFMPGDIEYNELEAWISGRDTSPGGMRRPQLTWGDFNDVAPRAAARIGDAIP